MEQTIIDMVLKQGVFAALFIWLFINTTKKNEERESKYQEIIEKNQTVIEEQSKAFTSLSGDVNEIKTILVIKKENDK